MNYKERATQLETLACNSASEKLLEKHAHVRNLWSEANSIPSGCGGTPFRSDARWHEERLRRAVIAFEKKYGTPALKKLNLWYGLKDE